jgi:hypothetical protein
VTRAAVPGWPAALAALVAATALAGCRDESERRGREVDPEVPAQTRAPARGRAEAPTLRADRFGPLGEGSRAERGALTRAFPGLQVSPTGGRFRVSRGQVALFSVAPSDDGSVSSVEIVSREVPTSLGARVGDRFETLEAAAGPLECNGGIEDRAGEVLCSPRKARNLAFAFEVADRRFAGDDVPPAKQRGLLAGAKVRRIHWTPPER